MTQHQKLLAHFARHKTIEPLQALANLGIYRLGARIYDLRQDGHVIHSELAPTPTVSGGHFARYTYIRGPQ